MVLLMSYLKKIFVIALVGLILTAGGVWLFSVKDNNLNGRVFLNDLPVIQSPYILTQNSVKVVDECKVIGVECNGVSRAYVLAAFFDEGHQVVNDVVGKSAITVTHSSRSNVTKVFNVPNRTEPLSLAVGGWMTDDGKSGSLLLKEDEIVYDQESGRSISGDQSLPYQEYPFHLTTWKIWKDSHRDTDVYVASEVKLDLRSVGILTEPAKIPAAAAILDDDCIVIGISEGGHDRAYVQEAFQKIRYHIVNDMIGTSPITIAYCVRTNCVSVYTDEYQMKPLNIAVGGWLGNDVREGTMLLRVGETNFRQDTHRSLKSNETFPYIQRSFERTTWKEWKSKHPKTDVYVQPPVMN